MNEFIASYKKMWEMIGVINGKTNVRDYWQAVAVNIVVSFALGLVLGFLGLMTVAYVISILLAIAGITMTIRRLNDIGKPPVYILVGLIPFIGWIVLIYWCVQPSV